MPLNLWYNIEMLGDIYRIMKRIFDVLKNVKLKISTKLVLFLFISIFVPVLLIFYGINIYAHKVMIQKETENITLVAGITSEKLDDMIQTATVNILTVMSEQDLLDHLITAEEQSKVSLEWFQKNMWIKNYLAMLSVNTLNSPHRISIIDSEYHVFSTIPIQMVKKDIDEIYEKATENYGRFMFSRTVNGEKNLTICSAIKDVNQKVIGVVMEDISYSEVLSSIDQHYEDNYSIYCIDENGEVFLSYNELPMDYIRIKTDYNDKLVSFHDGVEQQYLRFPHRFNNGQFTMELMIPISEIFYASQHFNKITFLLVGVMVIQSMLCIYIVVKWLANPIVSISRKLMDFSQNIVPIQFEDNFKSKDELGELIDQTENMSRQIYTLIEQEKILNDEKRKYELAALKAQINPHMIYNTLNTITFLAQLQGIANIEEISEAFSSLLHTQLKVTEEFIEIEKELDYIKKYVLIKKYNVTANIELKIMVSSELTYQKIIPFILQPLVENSIKHGFYNRTKSCIILIRITDIGQRIRIEVCDNGSGIAVDKLIELQKQLDLQEVVRNGEKEHIGLINTAKRISYIYRGQSGFSIISKDGFYTKIQVEYPINK